MTPPPGPRTALKPETLDMLERLYADAHRPGWERGEELTDKQALEYMVAWGRLKEAAVGYLPNLIQMAREAEARAGLDVERLAAALREVGSIQGHFEQGPVDEYGIPELRSVTDWDVTAAAIAAAYGPQARLGFHNSDPNRPVDAGPQVREPLTSPIVAERVVRGVGTGTNPEATLWSEPIGSQAEIERGRG